MTTLFKKLNLKEAHKEILVLNAPESFTDELNQLSSEVQVVNNANAINKIEFCLAFCYEANDIESTIQSIANKLDGDVVLWFCYAKKSSKKYRSDISRDNGWEVLSSHELEGVRLVSIDNDWSALRFRKVEYIKKMVRNEKRAMTEKGKQKTKNN
jgi:hypothetical protein